MNTVVVGLLYGDEGKGKVVDYQALNHDVVVRFQGGPNAGHTLYRNGVKIVLHQIPSGVLNGKTVVIGNGCIIDVKKLIKEVDMLITGGYTDVLNLLKISHCAHVILPEHIQKDIEKENSGRGNGSTKCGIGPCYSAKYAREGIRMCDYIKKYRIDDIFGPEKTINYDTIYTRLKECVCDTTQYLHQAIDSGYNLLFEGAQGAFLSIDNFMYPNVSSSNVDVGGVISGTGVNHKHINNVIGIVKSYGSRVGDGPFVTQIFGEDEEKLREAGQEYGATTGRPRKVGWLDLPMVGYISKIIGVDSLAITRIDTLIEGTKHLDCIPICVRYLDKEGFVWSQFPTNLTDYENDNVKPQYLKIPKFNMDDVNKAIELYKETGSCVNNEFNPFVNFMLTVQEYTGVRIGMISFGRERDQVFEFKNE